MDYELNSEDFTVTDAIRNQAEEQVAHINKLLKKETPIHIYFKKEGRNEFVVKMKLRYLGQDLFAEHQGPDLYQNLIATRQHIERQLRKEKTNKQANRNNLQAPGH